MFESHTQELKTLLGSDFIGSHGNVSHHSIKGISTDSRKILPGSLFIPLKGENFDGHDFIEDALRKGAHVALSEKPVKSSHGTIFQVKNSLRALQTLGAYWRQMVNPSTVIGVTGSNGKTSTKNFIGQLVKSTVKSVFITEGNLNNHIGTPLSLLQMPRSTKVAVIEMGMNHLGEISRLCDMAKPHWGVITNVGSAHIGEVGGFDQVAKAKCEMLPFLGPSPHLFAGISSEALLPYLRKFPHPTDLVCHIKDQRRFSKLESKVKKISLYNAEQKTLKRLLVQFSTDGVQQQFTLPMFGLHFASNFILALKVAQALGATPKKLQNAIKGLKSPPMRMEIRRRSKTGPLQIIDCYNANPESMLGLFETLTSYQRSHPHQTHLVLGDMRELGDYSEALHRQLAPPILHLKPVEVLTFGEDIHVLSELLLSMKKLPFKVKHFSSIETLHKHLMSIRGKNHLIALKASRGVQLERCLAP